MILKLHDCKQKGYALDATEGGGRTHRVTASSGSSRSRVVAKPWPRWCNRRIRSKLQEGRHERRLPRPVVGSVAEEGRGQQGDGNRAGPSRWRRRAAEHMALATMDGRRCGRAVDEGGGRQAAREGVEERGGRAREEQQGGAMAGDGRCNGEGIGTKGAARGGRDEDPAMRVCVRWGSSAALRNDEEGCRVGLG